MTKLLASVFCAILFAGVLVQEASARRGGARGVDGYRVAAWGRSGGDWRWFGFGVGRGASDLVGPGTCGTYRYWKGRKCVYDPLVELLPIAQVMKFDLALAVRSIKDPESGNGIPDILKSFLQFNDPWPANSWELTEPSLSYQSYYVRLFAAFTL